MTIKTTSQLIATVLVAGATLWLAGCATSGYQKAEKTSAGIVEYQTEITKGKQAIDATLQALGQVTETADTDPRAAFHLFTRNLATLESVTAKVRKRNQELKAKGDAYFKRWQQEIATMQNPEIRQLSEEQKVKLKATFDGIQGHVDPIKAKFDPWLSNLKDLRTYLSNDLTSSGINAARGLIVKAQGDGAEIQRSLDALTSELNTVANSLTPARLPAATTGAPAK